MRILIAVIQRTFRPVNVGCDLEELQILVTHQERKPNPYGHPIASRYILIAFAWCCLSPLIDKAVGEIAHGRHNAPAACPVDTRSLDPDGDSSQIWTVPYIVGKRMKYKELTT